MLTLFGELRVVIVASRIQTFTAFCKRLFLFQIIEQEKFIRINIRPRAIDQKTRKSYSVVISKLLHKFSFGKVI